MNDLEKAKTVLYSDCDFTCVLCKGSITYTSRQRGIVPMVDFLSEGIDLSHFSAADKIVGKAAAMLFVLADVKEVYAAVMSASAAKLLAEHGIVPIYDTLTECIVNRSGDGLCPMEKAVQNIKEPEEALQAIRSTLAALRK